MPEILYFDTLDSTNQRARELAGAGHGECVIVSDEQTAGRGRLDRAFASPRGEGLWFTQLLRPERLPPQRAGGLVFVGALSMAEALANWARVQIKWPNDLVLNGKKLCGMLAEAGFSAGGVDWLSIGIGVNLRQREFPPELPFATSLAIETGAAPDRDQLLRAYLARFAENYPRWLREDLKPILEKIRPLSATLGRPVRFEEKTGFARDFREDGALLIELADGTVQALVCGDVSVRGLYGYV
ncbi:MAG TPA: biotin--[acetyl-CoA-carboxylase] ligase [Candidatus Pullichristensenella excrementigallinarum]|uniref:Biotin--[acetyl-CoA-carboxylase] ligase n=1 Tax=Candidatus Pullichristensenella excrementigallinarum TaxID=2840907 RepID=A0A9D1ICZ2_9FIRM|nr:biotin--[acetyl-CoA-carboxylase] ligase [Candidatus Pullichristensenella excrementigallinarum]